MGIVFVLLQRATDSDGEWKTIQAGSRFLTDTETRYAVIELECLAVVWAVKKCHIFLSGLDHFTIITDHNPLVPILNTGLTTSKIPASAHASWHTTSLHSG